MAKISQMDAILLDAGKVTQDLFLAGEEEEGIASNQVRTLRAQLS